MRRNICASLLCSVAVAGAELAATGTFSTSTMLNRPPDKVTKSAMNGDHRDHCIRMSSACAIACGKASEHCMSLAKNGKGEHAATAALSADCSDCCAMCMAFVSRNSQLSAAMCECCAKSCDQCAAECEKMEGDEMKACVKACRECAAACRAMIGKAGSH